MLIYFQIQKKKKDNKLTLKTEFKVYYKYVLKIEQTILNKLGKYENGSKKWDAQQ